MTYGQKLALCGIDGNVMTFRDYTQYKDWLTANRKGAS